MRGSLVLCTLATLVACQFQPRGAEIDAAGGDDDGDASIETDAADPTGDASTIDGAAIDSITVSIDARVIDAATAIDAAMCPTACTSCRVDGTCVIDCGTAQCTSGVTCPPGRPCVVNCVGPGACSGGTINCLAATSCDITCNGPNACNAVDCAGATCEVDCIGPNACAGGGVDCTAGACEIFCNGSSACSDHVCCTGTECDSNECQSTNGGCCDCDGCGL